MSKKGAIEERHIVHIFEQNGYSAIRIPASGGGTKLDRPYVLAGNGYNTYAIEVKSSRKNNIYIRKEQINELKRLSKRFGAKPVICVKFTYKPYIILTIEQIFRTRTGNYKITRELIQNGKEITQIF